MASPALARSGNTSKHEAEFQKEGIYREPETITIDVVDPITEYDESAKQYTTYKIVVETNFPQYAQRNFSVRRRYSEFVALHKLLRRRLEENEANRKHGPVPALPGDTLTSLWGSGRFEPAFIEDRRKGLEVFLNQTTNHTFCRFDQDLHKFLQDQKAEFSSKGGWFS